MRLLTKIIRSATTCRRWASSYQADGKTTVTILNTETNSALMIDSYSQVGFRLNNGMMVLGPMALFPRSVLAWSVAGSQDISTDTLELFFRLEPRIDLLVLGFGDKEYRPNPRLIVECRSRGLNIEALATEQACATFNFLASEGRCVAAAMIPPFNMRVNEDDVARTKFQQQKLIDSEYDSK